MEHPVRIRDTNVTVVEVLRAIAGGLSYDQILVRHPELTLDDIRATANFAADLIGQFVIVDGIIQVDHVIEFKVRGGTALNLTEMRRKHPRAFAKWTKNEEDQLVRLFQQGESIQKMAVIHQRRPGAIRARLERLGLIEQKGQTGNGRPEEEQSEGKELT